MTLKSNLIQSFLYTTQSMTVVLIMYNYVTSILIAYKQEIILPLQWYKRPKETQTCTAQTSCNCVVSQSKIITLWLANHANESSHMETD